MNALLSDESESNNLTDTKGNNVVYMAFFATIGNNDEASGLGTLVEGEYCNDSSHEKSGDNKNLKMAYNRLYKDCVDAKKRCKKLLKRLTTTKDEKTSLLELLDAANKIENSLKVEREYMNNRVIELYYSFNKLKGKNSLRAGKVDVLKETVKDKHELHANTQKDP